MTSLTLTSPAFDDGDRIPRKHGYGAENVNPPLDVGGVPETAASLALIVDDPGAPSGVWDHWVVWNLDPDTAHVPEDWSTDDAVEGRNDFGDVGYGGPDPPDEVHTYRFRLFALDTVLDLEPGATADAVARAMEGHVVAEAQLTGTYAP